WVYFLAFAPTAIIMLHGLFDRGRGRMDEDTMVMAAIFQFYYLRLGIFFGAVGIFTRLIRGEMVERSLHYYLLAPVRREVLLVGKFLAGTIRAVTLFGGVRSVGLVSDLTPYNGSEGMLLLERDLLDQQIIDVHGRKVVRVNDAVLLGEDGIDGGVLLRIESVDVGARGAVRRLLRGVVPHIALRGLLDRIPPKPIPWEFVN